MNVKQCVYFVSEIVLDLNANSPSEGLFKLLVESGGDPAWGRCIKDGYDGRKVNDIEAMVNVAVNSDPAIARAFIGALIERYSRSVGFSYGHESRDDSAGRALADIRSRLPEVYASVKVDCPKGHGKMREWDGKRRCWECGWPHHYVDSAEALLAKQKI